MRCRLMYLVCATTLCASSAPVLAQNNHDYAYAVFRIDGLSNYSNVVWGLNAQGVVVGSSWPEAQNDYHAFVWDGKHTVDLGTFGGPDSEAWDVNDDGMVVGWADTVIAKPHAFVWIPQGGMLDLGTFGGQSSKAYSINENGIVVGSANFPGDLTAHAFRWDGNDLIDLGSLDESLVS